MWRLRIAPLLSIFVLFSCSYTKPKEPSLVGHWHSVGEFSSPNTFDITDSVVIVDYYSLVDGDYRYSLFDSIDGNQILPIFCGCGSGFFPVVKDLEVTGDTLRIEHIPEGCYYNAPLYFVKSDPVFCRDSHLLQSWKQLITFKSFVKSGDGFIDLDSIHYNNAVVTIGIGIPPDSTRFGSDPKIVFNDFYIEISDVPQAISYARIAYEEENRPVSLNMVIDSSVPKTFIEEVVRSIPIDQVDLLLLFKEAENGRNKGYVKTTLSDLPDFFD